MGRNNYFQFKRFKIIQKESAMKVGTDGILLGAWTKISGAENILDVGTGTGLIALMLAQRSKAKIVGIDIEEFAVLEATTNVCESPWKDQIEIQHKSFQEFAGSAREKLDVIVSNPPFFENDLKPTDRKKSKARHNDSLSFSELIDGVVTLLSNKGHFSIILPHENAIRFIALAESSDLFLTRLTKVKPFEKKLANRYLMEFSKKETALLEDCLIIYKNYEREYSADFKKLTKDFYLDFKLKT